MCLRRNLSQRVRRVLIPNGDGQSRPLGGLTAKDRVVQMVVKDILEPRLETVFHSSSYGCSPGRSAYQAVDLARRNCWKYDWVLDVDRKALFGTIGHDLI